MVLESMIINTLKSLETASELIASPEEQICKLLKKFYTQKDIYNLKTSLILRISFFFLWWSWMLQVNCNCSRINKKPFAEAATQKFLGKAVLKICSKFTGEHPCQGAISIKLQSNVIEIALLLGWSPVNSLHIFRTPF